MATLVSTSVTVDVTPAVCSLAPVSPSSKHWWPILPATVPSWNPEPARAPHSDGWQVSSARSGTLRSRGPRGRALQCRPAWRDLLMQGLPASSAGVQRQQVVQALARSTDARAGGPPDDQTRGAAAGSTDSLSASASGEPTSSPRTQHRLNLAEARRRASAAGPVNYWRRPIRAGPMMPGPRWSTTVSLEEPERHL